MIQELAPCRKCWRLGLGIVGIGSISELGWNESSSPTTRLHPFQHPLKTWDDIL